jgi:hypothetical protein
MKRKSDPLDEIGRTIRYECNRDMLAFLQSLKTRKTVTFLGQQYLRFGSRKGCMFLPTERRQPPKPSFPACPELLEFYSAFDGLRESDPPYAGHFPRWNEVTTLFQEWGEKEIAGFMEDLNQRQRSEFALFVHCPRIFTAANGDQIFQMPNGSFAWWDLAEAEIKKYASSFPQFLKRYITYRMEGQGWPFDSYGFP